MNPSSYIQLASMMEEQHGCTDKQICEKCARQTLEASDILSTYNEYITYALALYQAHMWARKQMHTEIRQPKERPIPSAIIQTGPKKFDFLRLGGLVFRRKMK